MLARLLVFLFISTPCLSQERLRSDIFKMAMQFQKKNMNKSFLKSWYLLRSLDQISDKNSDDNKKMIAALWASSEKLNLCKNTISNDDFGFHHISAYNQLLFPSISDQDVREIPALGSFKAGRQERYIAYDDPVSKGEWDNITFIKNNCLFTEEYDDGELDESLFRNQYLWTSLNDFKLEAPGNIRNMNLIEQQQYAIIIQAPKATKEQKELLRPEYLKARKSLINNLETYSEAQWVALEKARFLYFYDFIIKNGSENYRDTMTRRLLVNKKITDEEKLILLISSLDNKEEATRIYGERLCYLTSGDYAFYFCSKAINNLKKSDPNNINRRLSLYAEIFKDRKIKGSDRKITESSLIEELLRYKLDRQTIAIIKNMEGLDNKAALIKKIVWQKNIQNVDKAYKLASLLNNKTEAREDLFKLLDNAQTPALLRIYEKAFKRSDSKTLRWFSELLTQLTASELDTIIRYQPLIDGMSKIGQKYEKSKKNRSNYVRFSKITRSN